MLEALNFIGREGKSRTPRSYRQLLLMRRLVKVVFDYVIVIPALIFLAPLMIIIAVLIKLESPGPILHRRRVQGRLGRQFNAFSFRTVYTNSQERLLKNREAWVALIRNKRTDCDPRVTGMGVYLRRFGLDQLPILFNILARDMSLVGPYFLTKKDVLSINRQRIELISSVPPGFTGVWQVMAQRTSRKERARLEIAYIRNWSLALDMRILFATFSAIRQDEVT